MTQRFDPEWRPALAPVDDEADASRTGHAPHRLRPTRRGVLALGACTLLVAVAATGSMIAESRLSLRHDGLVSDCSAAVASMRTEHDRLRSLVARTESRIDRNELRRADPKLAATYARLREIGDPPDVSCDASDGNDDLKSRTERANRAANAYRRQRGRIGDTERAASALLDRTRREDDAARLAEDIERAQDLLDRTAGADMTVPYLRTRLSDSLDQARTLAASGTKDAAGAMADLLEDLMGQVRENARPAD